MIERIEIVKGGYSALYGTDALGGVVNIITKKGTRNETTVDVSFGSNSRQSYQLTNQGVTGKFSYFISGGLDRSNPYNYKGTTDILSEHSDYNNNNFFIRMDNRFTDRVSINLDMTHKGRNGYDDMDKDIYNNVAVSYSFKESTSTPSWLRYFDNHESAWMGNARIVAFEGREKMQGVEYQNSWEIGRHKIIAENYIEILCVNLMGIMDSGWASDANNQNTFVSSKYALFDLNASYDINGVSTVYFKFNNFTNQEYSSVNKQWHSPGRCFIGGATFRF